MAVFWLAGLASPLAVYALDLWEHSIGLALLAWGIVALLAALDDERMRWWLGPLAGLAFGTAFTMRTEALVYGFVATAEVCLLLLIRHRSVARPLVLGAGVGIAMGVPVLLNQLLESRLLDSSLRTSRAQGAATVRSGGDGLRLREGLVTMLSLRESNAWATVLFGLLVVGLLALVVHKARTGAIAPSDQLLVRVAGVLVVLIFVLRFAGDGLGFVPGFLLAVPLAVVALVVGWQTATDRTVVVLALAALPLVWAFQFSGGAVPQWSGRYVLTSSFLLLVVGAAALPRLARPAAVLVIGLSVVVTACGVAWLGVRSRAIDDVGRTLAARPEPALISTVSFFLRELGPEELDHRWLSTSSLEGARQAVAVVDQAGIRELALLEVEDGTPLPTFDGWQTGHVDHKTWLGTTFRIVTYEHD